LLTWSRWNCYRPVSIALLSRSDWGTNRSKLRRFTWTQT
jgi:hypothetical protein